MSIDLSRAKSLTEKHILLLKLSDAYEKSPNLDYGFNINSDSEDRKWLSRVGAILKRLSIEHNSRYKVSFNMMGQFKEFAIRQIKGQVIDAIEEIKLDLELDGRTEIGNAYPPGDTYRFFADLKEIINSAKNKITIVDPYFSGQAFDIYLSSVSSSLEIRILANQYSSDIKNYLDKHKSQFSSKIELKKSEELHDRIIFVDNDVAWIMGGSIKDAGNKATYLIPLNGDLVISKKTIYEGIWSRAKNI